MNCRLAERRMLRRHDGRLSPQKGAELDLHLRSCPKCRERENDYLMLFDILAGPAESRPRPQFWQRLEARLAENERENGWGVVRKWCRKAVPAALALTAALLAALLVFSPARQNEFSASETLLLRNDNPLTETRSFIEESSESKNMMLIFASAEEYSWLR